MGATGSFSCDACGKTYAWKPEIAGKRVKCKCGGKLTVPATDPAALADDAPEGFDDLLALAEGAPAHEESYAPPIATTAPAARSAKTAPARPANAGALCPSCNSPVDPAAVICINCGHNLKTGKKLKTAKLADDASAPAGVVPYRSFGVKNVAGEGMSPQKKKILAISLSAFLLLLIGGIVVIVIKGLQNDKQHQARLNSQPAKLEKLMENMDKAGGIGAAMHDGSLLNGVDDPQKRSAEQEIARQRAFTKFQEHGAELMKAKNPLAKEWLASDPKTHFFRHDHAASVKFVEQLEAFGATEIRCDYAPSNNFDGEPFTQGVIARLPKDPASRKRIFAWYDSLDYVMEGYDQPHPEELGQTYISIEFKPENLR
jgi:hypothetical protein